MDQTTAEAGKIAGTVTITAAIALVERIEIVLDGFAAPVEVHPSQGTSAARQAYVKLGGIDLSNRGDVQVPVVIVRPTDDRWMIESGRYSRILTIGLGIITKSPDAADCAYAWNIWDSISRSLADQPSMGASSQFVVDLASLQCAENGNLSETYDSYALSAQVSMIIPVTAPLKWDDNMLVMEENRAYGTS